MSAFAEPCAVPIKKGIRVATYNASLNRKLHGEMYDELKDGDSAQAAAIAEVIRIVDPDILMLQELDKGEGQEVLTSFHDHYILRSKSQTNAGYPFRKHFSSNTGMATGMDLDRDGQLSGPGDAQGFGWHQGQYSFAILSKLPITPKRISEFRTFLWRDLERTNLDQVRSGAKPWYDEQSRSVLRLSSKNHVAVPVRVADRIIWILAAHPTPPVFDGDEDRNGWRNFDEIRLLKLLASRGANLKNDRGANFQMPVEDGFVLMGDLNADPEKGDGREGAIMQLLTHPEVNQAASLGRLVPEVTDVKLTSVRNTSAFGLRVDYIIPSKNITVFQSGLCRPKLIQSKASTDHFLVWMDMEPSSRPTEHLP
jgi:endonuclease/exonuclease/phosphatase family metal-dependent hydrolase